ncbi:unnamed protein product [Mytilus coruscus]|uniref:Uncharacterized protein n=1 Tax=Mytilus coruscus TaxID=42192 RepID=A0A6J8BI67_MYTCO|nr:unnamed protein product [Mytilus coruscus]
MIPLDLEDRRKVVVEGSSWIKIKDGIINPFQNLKKEELIDELEERGVDTFHLNLKSRLQEELTSVLHGICRPPALLMTHPDETSKEMNIESYEVMPCEPLHDICNIVQNIITELPHHVENKETKSELENFCSKTIGDKNQIKGSDARHFAIQLAQYVLNEQQHDKISEDTVDLIQVLVEIINIVYSSEEKRSPRQILRLYNLIFLFGVLTKSVIGTPVKITTRKLYGCHFHSLVVHLPEVYRIVNTKSILCEQEERSFESLRRIAETTTNRKPGWIIDNTIIRYNAQQNSDDRSDSFAKQDSTISRQAKRLPHRKNTIFTQKLFTGKSSVVQSHLARIADFIIPGDQIWWHYDGENVVFHDSIDEPNFRLEGPPLSNYRSTSLKKEITNVNSIWENCISLVKLQKLIVPILRLKTKENGKVVFLDTQIRSATVNISKEKAIPPKKHNGDILDDLSTTEEPTMQDNEQEVEDPALILYDEESCSNQEEQTSILSDILPDAKLSNKEQKGSIDKEIRRLYFINVKEGAENRKGKLACNTSEPVKDVKASSKTIGHQKDQTKVKPVHATKLTAKRKLFETSQETTEPCSGKKTPLDLAVQLLGKTPEVLECIKYKGLKQNHPSHAPFSMKYDKLFSKLQIDISAKYHELKNKLNNSKMHGNIEKENADLKIAQKLLDHWGMYYF